VTVREIAKLIERDGWRQVRQAGSHRHYRHPTKPGTVTIPGHPARRLAPEDAVEHPSTGRPGPMTTSDRYLILVEGGPPSNYSAWSPDVPGCVATGETIDECVREMRVALAGHLAVMREHGEAAPEPTGPGVYVARAPAPAA
jgi:predicted RNA binding protein YcfA (HicA-like mRNA interferase family)/predicted RNase H-like HicB family nuclease